MSSQTPPHDLPPGDPPPGHNPHYVPQLSQELSDMFIDSLSGPTARADLQACSLTCRAWLHRSRTHLYRRIRLKPFTNIERFSAIYTPEALLPYVREVMILGCLTPFAYQGRDANSGLGDNGQPDHAWIDRIIPFLQRFNNVDWLHLHDLSWGDIAVATRQFILSQFCRANRLSLSSVDFWNSNQLFRVLQAFPHLSGLSMERLSWHRANHTLQQITNKSPLTLRYLHLGETEFARYGPFVHWFLGSREYVSVDEAFLAWEDTEVKSLVALMRRIAPSLKGLIYQQCMVLPGSDLVQARLAAQDALEVPDQVGNLNAMNQVQIAAPVPVHHHQGQQHGQNVGGAGVGNINAVAEGDFDDEDVGNVGIDPWGVDDPIPSSPPIELEDDDPEDAEVVEEFVGDNFTFLREDQANAEGLVLLDEEPIVDSTIVRLHARVVWSSLGLFGIKMLCQLFSVRTRVFSLSLVIPSRRQWDSVDWAAIDFMLDGIAPRSTNGTILDMTLQRDSKPTDTDFADLREAIAANLPKMRQRRAWTVKCGTVVLWEAV